MRRSLIALAVGLLLPLGMVHAVPPGSSPAATPTVSPIQTQLMDAMAKGQSIDAALGAIIQANPDQAYTAITAAMQLSPDQAGNIVSAALNRQYNLNPSQVIAAALQGAPEKAGVIVPTGIVKSPSYYTVPIVQRALAEGVDGAKFVPQAMRTSPRQADTILTQALRSAPQQTKSIMESVIADQPDKALEYVKIALDAHASPADVLTAAFKVAPRQADAIAAVAREKGLTDQQIAAASAAAGVEIAGLGGGGAGAFGQTCVRAGTIILHPITPPNAGGTGGGRGCSKSLASCS